MYANAAIALVFAVILAAPAKAGEIKNEFLRRCPQEKQEELLQNDKSSVDPLAHTRHGVSRFGIETQSMNLSEPSIVFTVMKDGNCTYAGYESSGEVVHRTGRVRIASFNAIAYLIVSLGYFDLQEYYACGLTDIATSYYMAARGSDEKYIAVNGCGPVELGFIRRQIEDLLQYVKWDGDEGG